MFIEKKFGCEDGYWEYCSDAPTAYCPDCKLYFCKKHCCQHILLRLFLQAGGQLPTDDEIEVAIKEYRQGNYITLDELKKRISP